MRHYKSLLARALASFDLNQKQTLGIRVQKVGVLSIIRTSLKKGRNFREYLALLPSKLRLESCKGFVGRKEGYGSRSRGWGPSGYRSGATAYATGSPGYRSYGSTVYGSLAKASLDGLDLDGLIDGLICIIY